jgi:hypothetical protein
MEPMSPVDASPCPRPRAGWILLAVGLTLLMEAVTVVLRVGGGLQSHVATAGLASLTLGLRLHHGYVGLAMLAASPWARHRMPGHADYFSAAAVALVLSDALHHAAAMWVLTGSPGFDLTYPAC